MPSPFKTETLYDSLSAFSGGVNAGDSPLDIPKNVMANSINTTVRGKFVTHRPAFFKRPITYLGTEVQSAVTSGYFQGHCQATDDSGNASFVALISQRVFQFLIQNNTITCNEIQIPGGPILPNQPQGWLWQTERWVIVNDGKNPPIFVDLNGGAGITPVSGVPNWATATRSNTGTKQNFSTTTASQFAVNTTSSTTTTTTTGIPTQNSTTGTTDNDGGMTTYDLYQASLTESSTINNPTGQSVGIPSVGGLNTIYFSSTSSLNVDDIVTFYGYGTAQVTQISGLNVTVQNLTIPNAGSNINSGVAVTWSHIGQQMPASLMGAYGMGRNWFALPGQLTFIAGDIVYGSSGTQEYNFRDAVLNVTENNFITGGGTFSIPASGGEKIQAMLFLATLDVSLGQGPLQVFTNRRVFSCQAPVDRLVWQSLTSPILTVSLIGDGAQGQNSTIMVKGDPLFRSTTGVSSLTFETVQFENLNNLWINSPLSFEVSPTLNQDNQSLLQWGSAVDFDNRALLTCSPVSSPQGVYFTGMVPINFDTTSTMMKKANPVWDGAIWNGMNILQLSSGEVSDVSRAFAFCLNTSSAAAGIEVYEILPSTGPLSQTTDFNGTESVPISWQFDSASLRFGVPPNERAYMALHNGEIFVEALIGSVTFNVQYKPDQYPKWQNWRCWTSTQNPSYATEGNPDFLPRQGLGEPSPTPSDCSTGRPLRNFFTLQTRVAITGHCIFLGAFYESETQPMPTFAPFKSC